MFIKKITIDGFKSYAVRTEVNGFDPQFNAITGLNGSGKSNILDAICFVLGISNLTQVRAGSLQELVYKQGQAGVTKASVCIVFDNQDKEQSPVGYQSCDEITVTRQIVIGGRNKYMINGQTAQPSRVQNLFHSVQLNVNNPHFLIMQGRITKVLNMKPPETLSLVEEAAGTRMYETKKMGAQRTMNKKQAKLEEIHNVLEEDITPTLNKLRKERSSYLAYQKTKTETEHLTRFLIAYDFTQAEALLERSKEEAGGSEDKLQELKQVARTAENTAADLKLELKTTQRRKDMEMGGELKALEDRATKHSKALVKANTTCELKKEARLAEIKAKDGAHKSIKDTEKAIAKKEAEVTKAEGRAEEKNAAREASEAHLAGLLRLLSGVAISASEDGGDASFAERLKAAKETATSATTELKQAQIRIKHSKGELKKKKPMAAGASKEFKAMCSGQGAIEKKLDALKKSLDGIKYDGAEEARLRAEAGQCAEQVAGLQDRYERESARLARLDFKYAAPTGFDRDRVKGLVACLIEVKDQQHTTALEVAAGSKLFNVVVDTEDTGKTLLDKGKLQRRVTIIPLSKVKDSTLPGARVQAARKKVGADKASLALSLVGFDDEVERAMKYVFGRTIICKDMAAAKQVTFDKNIAAKTVTLEGDVFDPSGTLTGGSRKQGGSVLKALFELNALRSELEAAKARMEEIRAALKTAAAAGDKHRKLKAELDLKQHEGTLLQTRIEQSTHFQIMEEVKELEKTVDEAATTLRDLEAKEKAAQKEIKTIEAEMKKFESERASRVKKAESQKAAAKTAVAKAKEAASEAKHAVAELQLELQSLREEIGTLQEQIAAQEKQIVEMEAEEEDLATLRDNIQTEWMAADAAVREKKEKLAEFDDKIEAINEQINRKTKAKTDAELEMKRLEHALQKTLKDRKDAAKRVEGMLARHEWIATERRYFGQEGTAFDFKEGDKERDPGRCRKRLAELQDQQQKLSKSINMKVLSMFDKAEKEYNDLIKKKKIVEEDKAKIESAIVELDDKKNQALKRAYERVNKDFGSIFSTLLPGSNARLEPVMDEEGHVLQGLEIRVAFGDVWKESLTELSGGQRSLVALSLILSLLLFKPAPLYILDEVDAALDLSHTQNIGQMLRQHFRQSQFVVVSLKDGMFNNANVLFKTKFVDGVSTVKRYAQSLSTADDKENDEATKATGKGKGKARKGGRAARALNV